MSEDKRVTSAEHTSVSHISANLAAQSCDSCFPPANSHMFEQRFLIHELGRVKQPSTVQCYCWSSARSRAEAGVLFCFLSGS